MARIRTIKPDFWKDYRMAEELTRDQRLLYIALWNEADDEGRFLAHPRRLLGAIFPYDRDIHESFIEDSLNVFARTGRLVLYTVEGEPYAQLTKFADHQRINRPQPSRIPPPPTTCDNSLIVHGTISEPSVPEVEVEREHDIPASQGKPDEPPEEKPKRTPAPRAHRLPADWEPTAEHAAYCEKEDIDMDAEAEKFRFHAEANGRKQQKWNAAFSTWLRSEIPKARRGSRRPGRPEYITRTG